MKTCPNCAHPVAADARLCPNCGQEMPPVWPPPPGGFGTPPGTPAPSASSNQIALGIVLGFLLSLGLGPVVVWVLLAFVFQFRNIADPMFLTPTVAAAFALGVYFGTRRRYPAFARAFGWTALIGFAVELGALTVCYVILRGLDNGG